jgi:hypothetical protein
MTTRDSAIWIGTVEVTGPRSNPVLDGGVGAYAPYLTMVSDAAAFHSDAAAAAERLELALVQVEWCEPLSERLRRVMVEEYLMDLAKQVDGTGVGAFGTFHAWEESD